MKQVKLEKKNYEIYVARYVSYIIIDHWQVLYLLLCNSYLIRYENKSGSIVVVCDRKKKDK